MLRSFLQFPCRAYFSFHRFVVFCYIFVVVFDTVDVFNILKLQSIRMLLFELFLLIVSCSHRSGWGI